MPGYGTIDQDYGIRLATCDPADDGGIYMLNLMKYRAVADYGPDGETTVSGREADDRYAPFDVLAAIGASVCFAAEVLDGSEDWDRVAVVRYPTRRSFVEMQSRPDFQDKHVHKEAGMDHTIVMGTLPRRELPGDAPGRLLVEVWHGDPPPALAAGAAVEFDVEGTIIGDGRPWSGARYTPLGDDETPDLGTGTPTYQAVVVRPVIHQWR